MPLLPVEDARTRILRNVRPVGPERVPLADALGRVLAAPVNARRDQPPFEASAMDGYAVLAADVASTPVSLKVVGTSAAGHGFRRQIRTGEAVRIFTGAPLPPGADTVVIQENTEPQSPPYVRILQAAAPGQNVRSKGLDFLRNEILITPPLRLNARDLGLAAAANAAMVRVRRKPVIALLATGDELVEPGTQPGPDQIVSSNSTALAALARSFGAEVRNLGIVADTLKATERAVARAAHADILVTTGGASVGDHDFVLEALKNQGVKIAFWKIAMRPGKPFMYGRRQGQHVMGLPGNPVSALVCARLFLKPLIDTMLGLPVNDGLVMARLGAAMKANEGRQDYVRATLRVAEDGSRSATPFERQDSSMQRTFRESDCLIVRPPHAAAAAEGDFASILILDF